MDNADAWRDGRINRSGSSGYVMAGPVESTERIMRQVKIKGLLLAFTYSIPHPH